MEEPGQPPSEARLPPDDATAPAFELDVDAIARASYAMAHNRQATVRSVRVRNLASEPGGQLTIRLRSRWAAADEPPLRSESYVVECPPVGDTVEIATTSCRLDDTALVRLDEAAPATIEVDVRDENGRSARAECDLLVLARNQWNSDLPIITAAFVQPHHPAIPTILSRASEILRASTGSGELQGYQSGPERTMHIARAVFQALQERVPTYINPPASFDDEGQKVRPLDQVLAESQGTCIDLACAYAACLQQAGLNTVIVLVHGHAFPCFFTQDQVSQGGEGELPNNVVTDVGTLQNLAGRGLLVPVESTAIPSSSDFAGALQAAAAHLNDCPYYCEYCQQLNAANAPVDYEPHLRAAIDVRRAFERGGIRSLPVRVVSGDVVTIVIDNGPHELPVTEKRDARTNKVLPATVPARVQQWKNALLDLSLRNKLLNFNAPVNGIELLTPSGSLGDIEDYLVAGHSIDVFGDEAIDAMMLARGIANVRAVDNETLSERWNLNKALFGAVQGGTLQTRAKNLISKAKLELQETAVNSLNLALGTVVIRGGGSTGKDITAPLFLVPVVMTWNRGRTAPVISIDPGGMTTLNYCLVEWLRAKEHLDLPWFRSDMRDDSGLDIMKGLNELRRELLDAGVSNRIIVNDDAAVAILRFDKIRLWKDLDDHWESFLRSPVVDHLVAGVSGGFRDSADPEGHGTPAFDDTTLLNPQPADGAQTAAVVRALAGHSFVLEGPPGTGKSQTITNLLANALANGKKVLFVAQKQAALGVVRERLEAVGLDPFCLDLHDKGSSTEKIKSQLRTALDFTPTLLPERWDKVQSAFDVAARSLEVYRARLHDPTKAGRSYAGAYTALLQLGPGPVADAGRALAHVDAATLGDVGRMLLELPSYTDAARPTADHPWRFSGSRAFDEIDRPALAGAIHALSEAVPAASALPASWVTALSYCPDTASVTAVGSALALVERNAALPAGSDWRTIAHPDWQRGVEASLDAMHTSLTEIATIDPGIPPSMLGTDLAPQLAAVKEAAGSFFLGRKGRIRNTLGPLATSPAFSDPATAVATMERLGSLSDTYRRGSSYLASAAGTSTGMTATPVPDLAGVDDLRWYTRHLAFVARSITADSPASRALTDAISGTAMAPPNAAATVQKLALALQQTLSLTVATPDGLAAWTRERSLLTAVHQSLPTWRDAIDGLAFVTLHRWCDLNAHIARLEQDPFNGFRRQILDGVIGGEDADEAFERALMNATLLVVGEDHQFDVFDWMRHDRQVDQFVALLDERQRLLQSVIPSILHGSRTFDSRSTIGAVGQLRTELNSKRRGARSVRDLVSKYPELISQLTPCFLMGPDSVAKFLEPGTLHFDLVVFDEASQITVPDAVGAMGRAASVVIVGDSRQMPPSSAFSSSSGSTDEDDLPIPGLLDVVPEDADSILEECVESGLPREMLSWHYRSRDELLIAFSNDHYYEGRLASFPSALHSRADCGLVFNRVAGQFDHGRTQTNQIEADAIVAEIRRRVHDPILREFSVGVVTLNLPQARLILEKLAALQDAVINELLETDDPDREIFVLNLESVQGRERDVIILGTSFSRRANGDAMPLNFGPLNQKRGERRLNVAITRARRQVVIFSSFDPEELGRATAVGMVHLKEYLELARKASLNRDGLQVAEEANESDLHTREVADALRARGLLVRENFGLSSFKVDLAVTLPDQPDRWLAAVLLDGPSWGRRQLALDRDALPLTVLRNLMDWPAVARVWLPAWRRDREEIISHIHDLVTTVAAGGPVPGDVADTLAADLNSESLYPSPPEPSILAGAGSAPVTSPSSDKPSAASVSVPNPAVPPLLAAKASDSLRGRLRPHSRWEMPGIVGTPDMLEYSGSAIREYLGLAAEAEGPILLDEALKKVARGFGLERVRGARLDVMRPQAPKQLLVTSPFGSWLFPSEYLDGNGAVSRDFDWYRITGWKIQDVAPHEIANALVELTRAAHRIGPDELAGEVLGTFGYARRSADAVAHTRRIVDWAVKQGYLVDEGGTLRTP